MSARSGLVGKNPPGPIWANFLRGPEKSKKILKIKIRVAQNVGKVWITKKNPPGPIWCHFNDFRSFFCVGRKNQKNIKILPIFLGGPRGPIQPLWANLVRP